MVDVAISQLYGVKNAKMYSRQSFQKMQRYGNGEIAFSDRKTPLPGYEIKAIASKLQQITLND